MTDNNVIAKVVNTEAADYTVKETKKLIFFGLIAGAALAATVSAVKALNKQDITDITTD